MSPKKKSASRGEEQLRAFDIENRHGKRFGSDHKRSHPRNFIAVVVVTSASFLYSFFFAQCLDVAGSCLLIDTCCSMLTPLIYLTFAVCWLLEWQQPRYWRYRAETAWTEDAGERRCLCFPGAAGLLRGTVAAEMILRRLTRVQATNNT